MQFLEARHISVVITLWAIDWTVSEARAALVVVHNGVLMLDKYITEILELRVACYALFGDSVCMCTSIHFPIRKLR